jgi:hypothetical protein
MSKFTDVLSAEIYDFDLSKVLSSISFAGSCLPASGTTPPPSETLVSDGFDAAQIPGFNSVCTGMLILSTLDLAQIRPLANFNPK